MPPEQNHAPDDAEVWLTLGILAAEARKADAEHRRELYEVKHRQMNDLLDMWGLERVQPSDPTLPTADRIRVPGAV